MTNSVELRSIIKSSGMTYKHIAEKVGITPYCLAQKIDNRSYFNSVEIQKMCSILGITSLKRKELIFFSNQDDK